MIRRAIAVVALLALLAAPVTAHTDLNAAINAYRTANGLSALAIASAVEEVAHQRAVEIAASFRHVDLTGRLGCYRWGEIIAWNTAVDPISYGLNQWATSPAHNALMLGGWTAIGSGTHVSGGSTYLVVIFLNPCGGPIVDVIPDTSMGAP